ncbi:MAG: hypothetical protein IH991_25180 [Planctomycetes bacterium]|nr:hypothetical protein [Planctomycetota bacterium]
MRIVYRLVGNRDDAADCFQETFLAAIWIHFIDPGDLSG